MAENSSKLLDGLTKYRLEIRHVTVLFIVLLIFQIVVSILHKASLQKSLINTQEWYQQDSAEKLANLTTTSLELLIESQMHPQPTDERDRRKMVQGLNIILSQQNLNQSVQEICVLVPGDSTITAIDDGRVLYEYMFESLREIPPPEKPHTEAIAMYARVRDQLRANEQIRSVIQGKQTFHVFVPFVPRGEFVGAVYMRNTPNFSFITREIISSYDETSLTFSALILFGLLAMFYISSYTLRERNDAQQKLFASEKEHLAAQITHQKEMLFTKRIYHTHHKAEKVMGFIKEDLRTMSEKNIEEVKSRVLKYSNFIARVIYDMKWYDPPIQTIRGPLFRTDLNSVLRFMVDNVFLRVSTDHGQFRFVWDLDSQLPAVPVNEFVVWEAFEPVIQNSLVHAGVKDLVITLRTRFGKDTQRLLVMVEDNGVGIEPGLLERDERGIQKLFLENVTTKGDNDQHSGYGCYIAYEIATQRCGWSLDAVNLPGGGARFTFTIPRTADSPASSDHRHGDTAVAH